MTATSEPTVQRARARPRIGVFIEWLADGYADPIVDEISLAAREQDVEIVCFVGGLQTRDFPRPQRHLPLVYASPHNIDAVLVVAVGNELTANQTAACFRRFEPLPMVSVAVHWDEYPRVMVDNETGVRTGVRHLIRAHGRRRIACVRGPEVSTEAETRFRAYREVLAQHGIPYDPDLVASGFYIKQNGIDAVRLWLDERRVVFDAVVAGNDGMAIGVLEELERRQIRVPEDVALFGFDDTDEARYARPPLTTVRQPVREHARRAFELVLAQMAGHQVPLVSTVGSEVVIRRSCGCIASAGGVSSAPPPAVPSTGHESPNDWVRRVFRSFGSFSSARGSGSIPDPQLTESFLAAVADGDRTPFLRRLESLLDAAARRRQDVLGVFRLLGELRHEARRRFSAADDKENVEALLHDADTLIAEVAERAQAKQRYRSEELFVHLVRTNEALVTALNLPALAAALTPELGRFGINRCFVCTYEGEGVPAESARLVVACDLEHPMELPAEGLLFPAHDLLPPDLLASGRQSTWLVCPMLRRGPSSPGYVVFERGVPEGFVYDGLLDQVGSAYQRIGLLEQVVQAVRLREIAERERLEREMQIATGIQTGILPRNVQVDGLEISAAMHPATEVGGDYYDVIPVANGCWLGIGDVAGHGLPTGLVMLMLQSVVGGLVRHSPAASPRDVLVVVNELLFDNVRRRMGQDEHVTLTLIRYDREGRLVFAGAHEYVLICRARTGTVERLRTPGTWVAAIRDIREATEESSCELEEGDLLLLYTDGVTEAMSDRCEMFGVERLELGLARHCHEPVDQIRDALIAEVRQWTARQDDDLTILVARQGQQFARISPRPATSGA